MGITKADIAAQRAMIERGEEKRKAARQAEERERLRDTFAAAALTGLLSNIPRYQLGVIAVQAYDIADEMLRERLRNGAARGCESEHYRGVEELGRPRRAHNPEIAGSNPAAPIHDAVPEAKADGQGRDNPAAPAMLTDWERYAIKDAIKAVSEALDLMDGEDSSTTATLRNLLERLK